MNPSSLFQSVGKQPGGSGSLMTILPISPGCGLASVVAQHPNVVAGNRPRRRTGLDRHLPEPDAVGERGPAELRLPPVIDHRHAELRLRPINVSGSQRSPARYSRRKRDEIVRRHQLAVGILALDRAKRGRRREEHADAVLRAYAPERAGIGRADRLAFVEHRRAAVEAAGAYTM